MMTASTGASLKPAASRALLPWQKITSSPTPAPTLSTATMVFTPGRNLVGSFSSTSCGRNRSSLRPFMLASFLVETTEPSTRAKNMFVRGAQPPRLQRLAPSPTALRAAPSQDVFGEGAEHGARGAGGPILIDFFFGYITSTSAC